MLNFILLLLIPIVALLLLRLFMTRKVTWAEVGGGVGIVAVFILISLGVAYWQNTTDTEIWNGEVIDRHRAEVSCSHSYQCNCVKVSCGKDCETEICQTCYEHDYDVDWWVTATTGERVYFDTRDRQGLIMPDAWKSAYSGEPFSSRHSYTNYILANPDSVLVGGKGDIERFRTILPEYNATIQGYYYHDPVINMGVPILTKDWTWLLREANKKLGPKKQVNIVLVLAKTDDPKYVLALKDYWLGGKKNDAVIVIGSVDGHKIEFADVISWTTSAAYKVELRDAILQIGSLDQRDAIVQAINNITTNKFQRMHMKDFKYLMRSFQPSTTAMWTIFLLSLAVTTGWGIFSVVNEFEDWRINESTGNSSWKSSSLGRHARPWVSRLQQRRKPF